MWHPQTVAVQSPSLDSVISRDRPPPVELPDPRRTKDVSLLGVTTARNRWRKFGIGNEDRFRHVYVIGKTGVGKSTLLRRQVVSDIEQNRGVAVIEPHGDLIEEVLSSIPKRRTHDTVLFDLADREHPVAFNLLDCPDPEERPKVASGVVVAFKKVFAESWGPRMEHYFRNALLALLEVRGTTLLSLARFLEDPQFRSHILRKVKDQRVRDVWEKDFASKRKADQQIFLAPIQNKLSTVLSYPQCRNVFGQSQNRLKLREIMDQEKIFLCSLSKGRVGEDVSQLVGALLLSGLQLAAMSRQDQPISERRDFHVFVDEFQSFSTESFATFLSEIRKFRVSLTLSHQYVDQLDEPIRQAVFGNVQTLICFQVGAEDCETLCRQLGDEVSESDLLRLPQHHAYVRLLMNGEPTRPFSMKTLRLGLPSRDSRIGKIRGQSRRAYARPRAIAEQEISQPI